MKRAALLLPLVVSLLACDGKPPEGPGANAGAGAAAPAPQTVDWDPDTLLGAPGEFISEPGSGTTFLEGTVVDEAGNPVPGATVEVHSLPRSDARFLAPRLHAKAACAADGSFRVGPGPSPWWHQGLLSAVAPGHARASLVSRAMTRPGFPCAEPGEPARLVLRRGHPVEGKVAGKDGLPPDGPVTLWAMADGGFTEIVESDAAGAFRFLAPEGRLAVEALDGPHPMARGECEVAAEKGGTMTVEVVRGRDVRGRVVDAATGKPVAGAVLRAYYGKTRLFRSGPDGEFLLPKHWFRGFQVRAPGYALRTHRLADDAGSPGVPPETVRLEPGFTARGRVLDLDGKPVAHARLRVLTRDPAGDWGSSAGPFTGKDGTFVFVGLPLPGPGREVPLFAHASGFSWGVSAPLAGTAGAVLDGAEVRLPREVDLEGTVLDGDGIPLAAAMEYRFDLPKALEPYGAVFPSGGPMGAGEDGKWRIRVPERTRYSLVARSDFYLETRIEGTAPAAGAPGATGLVLRVDRGLSIRGTAVDSAGKPVGRGEVRIEPNPHTDKRPSRDSTIRPDGTFDGGGLAAGSYDISVLVHPEFLQEVVRGLEAGGPPVKVVLRRPGGLKFKVVLPPEVPDGTAPEVALRALEETRPLAPDFNVKLDPYNPVAAIGPLAPAAYSLSITAGDFRQDIERVVVGQGAATDLGDLALVRGAVVAGTVTLGGVALPGVPVEAIRALPDGTSRSVKRGKSGPDGEFRLGGLLPGKHILAVRCPDRPFVDLPFETTAGTTTALDVRLEAGARLKVTVKDGSGNPVGGATVLVLRDGASVPFWREGNTSLGSHTTGVDGTLRCTGLPAGTLQVKAERPGAGSGDVTVEVKDGAEGVVEVKVGK